MRSATGSLSCRRACGGCCCRRWTQTRSPPWRAASLALVWTTRWRPACRPEPAATRSLRTRWPAWSPHGARRRRSWCPRACARCCSDGWPGSASRVPRCWPRRRSSRKPRRKRSRTICCSTSAGSVRKPSPTCWMRLQRDCCSTSATPAPRYRFRHALVREVLDHGLSAAQRGELHAAAGEALEQRGSPSAEATRLAYHWSRAIGPQAQEKTAAWSLRAARDAVAGFGFEAAVTHYARALASRSGEAITVSVEFGEALQMCGDMVAAREVLLGAAREAVAARRPTTWPGPRSPSAAAWPASRSRCRTRRRQTCCGRPMRRCRRARPRCGPRYVAGCRWRSPARHRSRTGWRWRRMRSGWQAPLGTS